MFRPYEVLSQLQAVQAAVAAVVAMLGAVDPGWAAVPETMGAAAGKAALVVLQEQVAMAAVTR